MSLIDVEVPQLELTKVSKLTPVGNQLLISPMALPKYRKSKSGFITAIEDDVFDPSDMPLRFGLVLAAGTQCEHFKEGDVVYYTKFAGKDADLNGGRIMQMAEHEILGVCDAEYEKK